MLWNDLDKCGLAPQGSWQPLPDLAMASEDGMAHVAGLAQLHPVARMALVPPAELLHGCDLDASILPALVIQELDLAKMMLEEAWRQTRWQIAKPQLPVPLWPVGAPSAL
jgi:hypothetical protein